MYGFSAVALVGSVIFVCAGIFRLIRFSYKGFIGHDGTFMYQGLPVFASLPCMGMLLASYGYALQPSGFVVQFVGVCVSLLMVSTIPVPKPTHPTQIAVIVSVAFSGGLILLWIG